MPRLFAISLVTGAMLLPCAGWAQSATPVAPIGGQAAAIVQRMDVARRQGAMESRAYSVVRNYQLSGREPEDRQAEVLTRVDFVPPNRKSFEILRQQGSGRGAGVVRRLLEGEVESAANGAASEFSDKNYEFAYAGEERLEGRACHVLRIEPRRAERNLLRGRVWVDAQSYRPVRVEGEPARNPSWWLKNTHVVILFANRDGQSLPVASSIATDVRWFGPHLLTWREVSYQRQSGAVAQVQPQKKAPGWARRAMPAVIEAPPPR